MENHLLELEAQLSTLNVIYEFCEDRHERDHIEWLKRVINSQIELLNDPTFLIEVDDDVREELSLMIDSINDLISYFDVVFSIISKIRQHQNIASKLSQINWIYHVGIDVSGLSEKKSSLIHSGDTNLSKYLNRIRWKKAGIPSRVSWISLRAHDVARNSEKTRKEAYRQATDEWNIIIKSIGD